MREVILRTGCVVAALIALSSPAVDADDVMSARFGNTIIAKGDHEVHMYFNADHTFVGKVVDVGFDLKGTWTIDGDKLCLTYNPPPPTVINPVCQPVDPHNIGDTWVADGRTMTLVQGIQ